MIYINGVMGFILLLYLDIFACLEATHILVVHGISMDNFPGAFDVGQSCARF